MPLASVESGRGFRIPAHGELIRENGLHAEIRPLASLGTIRAEWDALAQQAIERNLFVEPAFLLHAAVHLTDARNASAILIWQLRDGQKRLVGLFPVHLPRLPGLPGQVKGFHTVYGAAGTPLVAADQAEAAIEACLDCLARQGGRHAGLLLPNLPLEGPFAQALMAVMQRTTRTPVTFGQHERAILRQGDQAVLSPKKNKEMRRLARRLAEQGEVTFERATKPTAVREAVEIFLSLEAGGWKSRRGTALLQDAGSAAFTRAMTRDLARRGQCRVDVMKLDGRAIAVGIVLDAGAQSYYWKTAYDEAFAPFSPGVQLTLGLSKRQSARQTIAFTDSCAVAEHPMIDHVWSGRTAVADVFIPTASQPSTAVSMVVLGEASRRRIVAVAKTAYRRMQRNRKP